MQNIGLRSSGINGQNLGFKSDKAVSTLTFRPSSPFFSLFLPHGDGKSFKEKVCDGTTNCDITSGRGDVVPKGWLRAAQGRMGSFRDFSTIPKNVKFNTYPPNKVNPVFLVRRLYKRGGRQVERRRGGGRGGVEWWSPYQ